ncbi:MAG: hypothetical protein K8R21_08675 [Leptospira sp.]|nr:hypothetical protein [Leptospira sp.]
MPGVSNRKFTTDERRSTRIRNSIITYIRMTMILIFCFLFQSQTSVSSEKYKKVRYYLKTEKFEAADAEISRFSIQNKNDPELNYLQAELWASLGEKNYKVSNLKTAFEYFKKVYIAWPNHKLGLKRYNQLKDRKLRDLSPVPPKGNESLTESSNSGENKKYYLIEKQSGILVETNKLKPEDSAYFADLFKSEEQKSISESFLSYQNIDLNQNKFFILNRGQLIFLIGVIILLVFTNTASIIWIVRKR